MAHLFIDLGARFVVSVLVFNSHQVFIIFAVMLSLSHTRDEKGW